ncbi:TPA: hypothetical protein EYP66_03055 [Candidatus Poribacteria bacterium]|nr:hypothetical protein [Candidatus Poribacteria bacterium]
MVLLFGLILPIICAIIAAVSGALTVRRLFREKNPDLLSLVGLVLTLFFGIIALVLPMQSLALQHGQLIEQHNQMIGLLQEILKSP